MTTLPIVERELVVAARRKGAYSLRFWAAAGALVVFLIPSLYSRDSLTDVGQGVFIFLGGSILLFSMLAGVFLTADSLSVEKREGTLGLLFLTDLKGYDVVLGKLAANSLHSVFGLLAVFPVLALPLLTGGVSGAEFWRAVLVFMVTMYLSLGVGMLLSAASHEGRQAMGGTFAAMTFLAGVLPVLWQLQTNFAPRWHFDFLLWPSPVYTYVKSFDAFYLIRHGASEFWRSLALLFALGSGCILAASFHLPRCWQKAPAARPIRRRKHLPFFNPSRRRRPPLENCAPFLWLALGDRGGQAALNRIIGLVGLLWAMMLALSMGTTREDYISFAILLAFALQFAVKTLIAAESGRRFHQDRYSGALELVLATPLPVADIVAGQRKALRAQFQISLWALSVVNIATYVVFLSLVFFIAPGGRIPGDEFAVSLEIFFGSFGLAWLDASALIWVGMWRGLTMKKYSRSVISTWGQVMTPSWFVILLLIVLSIMQPRLTIGTVQAVMALWIIVGVVVDLAVINSARNKLETSLRIVVAESGQS